MQSPCSLPLLLPTDAVPTLECGCITTPTQWCISAHSYALTARTPNWLGTSVSNPSFHSDHHVASITIEEFRFADAADLLILLGTSSWTPSPCAGNMDGTAASASLATCCCRRRRLLLLRLRLLLLQFACPHNRLST